MSEHLIQPYLFFGGRCEEALEFYQDAIGAEVEMVMHYKDSPEAVAPDMIPEGYEGKVMHASFRVGGSLVMASDGCGESLAFGGFSLSLGVETEEEADRAFNALADGGKVIMPLGKTFWSPRFGMVTDRFGLCWMVSVEKK